MERLISVRTLIVLVVGTGLATAASADTITVCWDGSGDHLTIQEGIDAASNDDEVVVCDGVYTGTGNKRLDFGGKPITVRSANGPENCIIDCEGDGRGFYFHSGEGPDSVVEGFTIRNALPGFGDPASTSGGGGAYCADNSSPTITNCTISGNSAYHGGGVCCRESSNPTITNCTITGNSVTPGYASGGGVKCENSSPTITNCTISENSATLGGGIKCDYGSPTITDSTISGNSAGYSGGGVDCAYSDPIISGCTISGNSATGAAPGGGMNCHESSPTITNCTISGNSASGSGGGVCCGTSSNPAIANCVISENSAGASGGGVYCYMSSPVITDCTISANPAGQHGGGVGCHYICYPTITNCTISGNSADEHGGGLYCQDNSDPTISDCTISANSAGGSGGGVYSYYASDPTISNSILWDDTPDEIVGPAVVTYSDVQGGWTGSGNIDADPLFVGPVSADYHLSGCSPTIDAGDNDAVPEGIDTDLDGNPRFLDDPGMPDDGNGDPPIVDMGAYEFQGETCFGDLDGDNDVDLSDLARLLADYGSTETVYTDGDLDRDEDVDLTDLAALLAVYGTTCP